MSTTDNDKGLKPKTRAKALQPRIGLELEESDEMKLKWRMTNLQKKCWSESERKLPSGLVSTRGRIIQDHPKGLVRHWNCETNNKSQNEQVRISHFRYWKKWYVLVIFFQTVFEWLIERQRSSSHAYVLSNVYMYPLINCLLKLEYFVWIVMIYQAVELKYLDTYLL